MDPFKKFLYAGVDLIADTSDKFSKTVTDLVEKGKISNTEGKKLVDEWFERAESTKEEFEDKVQNISKKVGITEISDEEELEGLRVKVADLEAKLGKNKSSSKKAAASA